MEMIVFGARGMLGAEVCQAAFKEGIDYGGFYRGNVDITCKQAVRATLEIHKPKVVINCAGLTKHRDPEPTADEYRRVNTYGPLLLARECDRIGARLVHVSTDCVFSGDRNVRRGAYIETDAPDADDEYGWSKAEGEVTGAPHLTVRCSFIGNGDRGLLAWLRAQHGEVSGWDNVYWSGSTAPAIARALVWLAKQRDITGLFHLARFDGVITKGRLLRDLIEVLGLDATVRLTTDHAPVNRWLWTKHHSVWNRYHAEYKGPLLPPLYEALRELAGG